MSLLRDFSVGVGVERLLDMQLNDKLPQAKVKVEVSKINFMLSESQSQLILAVLNENMKEAPPGIRMRVWWLSAPKRQVATAAVEKQKPKPVAQENKVVAVRGENVVVVLDVVLDQIGLQILKGTGYRESDK